jgi:hypothetical protein
MICDIMYMIVIFAVYKFRGRSSVCRDNRGMLMTDYRQMGNLPEYEKASGSRTDNVFRKYNINGDDAYENICV